MSLSASPEEPKRYVIRLTPRAAREAEESFEQILAASGDLVSAQRWYAGLREKIGSLSTLPTRFPLQEEESQKMGLPVRRFLYRESPAGSSGYYVFYVVHDDSPDGPNVMVYHIRHAARRSMTAREAREIVQGTDE
jgi:plasmid stabilization system protein ParE